MRFIGIDLGTTTIKGAILNLETGGLERFSRRPFPGSAAGLPRLRHEVDPDAVVGETQAVLSELLEHAPDAAGLTLCSQMHGFTLLDGMGKALMPILTWQDQRALEPGPDPAKSAFDTLRERMTADELRQIGNDLWVMRPVSALFGMAARGALPPGARFVSIPDFVAERLCGAPVATDIGHAAASSMFNLETGDWHHGLIDKLGLGRLRLPRVAGRGEAIGVIHAGGRELPVFPPMADQQCSLYGAGLQMGELSINVSTGSQVGMLKETLAFGDFQTRPFYGGRWLLTCIHVPAGRSLNALVRLLTELAQAEGVPLQRVWENIEALAEKAGDTDLGVDLSFFSGALGSEGSITRIREDNLSAGSLFRAAFDSMAANYRMLADRISPGAGWSRVVFSGGLVLQMSVLRELILRRFNGPHRLAEGGEDALMGILADCRERLARRG